VDFQLNFESEMIGKCDLAEPLCVEPSISVREALARMKDLNCAAVLICRDNAVVGIYTERDALRMMASGADFDVPIEQVMTRDPVVLRADDSVAQAINAMTHGGYRRLPIVDDRGKPLGIIKVEGILHYLVEHFPTVIYTLPPKPHYTTQEREGA
jgi:CBS domain-containing protein